LEDILKFDKVQAYVAENNLDQKLEQAEIEVFLVILKRKGTMDVYSSRRCKDSLILIMIKLNQCR
jgi:hypothetical protein